jgi:hypothetical protein
MSQLVKTKRQAILKILSEMEPLRGPSNKKTLYSTRSFVNWAFFGTRRALKRSFGPLKPKKPNLRRNSLNNVLFFAA